MWVRGGPSANFKAVAKLEENDKVKIIGRNEDGTWLHLETADGTTGWSETKYLATKLIFNQNFNMLLYHEIKKKTLFLCDFF